MDCELKLCPPTSDEMLNALFAAAWPSPSKRNWQPMLDRALFYVCAYRESRLVGFAKVIGDGGAHAFLLDPTVSPTAQRHGIGRAMVLLCAQEAKLRCIEWLHVDFEARLKPFYDSCGFQPTAAGLLDLKAALPI